jgi:2,5-diketo-D-gluconate reductase B
MTPDTDTSQEILSIRGTTVPRIGFGTWQITGAECEAAVRDALEIGYRHIDTARAYENEAEVGRAIADSGVAREDLFVTTKIWTSDFEPGRLKAAAEDSLRKLRHGPRRPAAPALAEPRRPLADSLGAMTELREAGRIRELGVSNFPAGHLRRALDAAPSSPTRSSCTRSWAGPSCSRSRVRPRCCVTAYAPLAHGKAPVTPTCARSARRTGSRRARSRCGG